MLSEDIGDIIAEATAFMAACYAVVATDTLLHECVRRNFTRAISVLLVHGCDANCRDHNGFSPLHEALLWDSNEIVQLLVKKGYNTDVNLPFDDGYGIFIHSFIHSFIHFWPAPLSVRSAKRRHQSPEWMILSHVRCFIQGEVH